MPEQLVLTGTGDAITPGTARDVIGEALAAGAHEVVIPVERLDASFFDLSNGVAGDIVQAFVVYRLRLVIVGVLPFEAQASRSFAAFVREANRGSQLSFRDA